MHLQRYLRNQSAISQTQQNELTHKKVFVAGCGGLGGYVIECLLRLGVGHLVVVDGDIFEESNLNRQLLSSNMNLGKPKILAVKHRAMAVNSHVEVDVHQVNVDESNINELLSGCDVAVDALDNIPSRMVLQDAAEQADIPLVHGAIAGWCGQVCVIQPGERKLDTLYPQLGMEKGAETELGCLSFTASLVASIQAAETVKLLLGIGGSITGLMTIDLLGSEINTIQFS